MPSPRYFIYPETAQGGWKSSDPDARKLDQNYQRRDSVDEDGHWCIFADTLTELIEAVDAAIKSWTPTYEMEQWVQIVKNFEYEQSAMRTVYAGCDEDMQGWRVELSFSSLSEL